MRLKWTDLYSYSWIEGIKVIYCEMHFLFKNYPRIIPNSCFIERINDLSTEQLSTYIRGILYMYSIPLHLLFIFFSVGKLITF